jgi:hypothetical protein
MQNRRNYYRILHVQPDAPPEIIRMSYLTLMQRLKMHPDLGGDHSQAALINEAFATLMDPDKRASYDRLLARERAFPGFRSTAARGRSVDASERPSSPDPFACTFCGYRFPPHDAVRIDALCGHCDSPLCPSSQHQHEEASRRAMTRTALRLPVEFYLSWPQHPPCRAVTEDVSITGLRFTSTLDLVPNERLKIDCELCSAVAVVRHAQPIADTRTWSVGVEFLTLRIHPVRGLLVSRDA